MTTCEKLVSALVGWTVLWIVSQYIDVNLPALSKLVCKTLYYYANAIRYFSPKMLPVLAKSQFWHMRTGCFRF